MLASVEHRGRDDSGTWVSEAIDASGRRACLGVCAFMGGDNGRIRLVPHHTLSVAEGNGERGVRRRIERRAHLRQTTEGARTGMCDRRTRRIVQAALLARAVADDNGRKRIGHGLAGRQTGGDRRQHLHRQSEQDQGKEFLQPYAHPPNHLFVY